MRKPVESRLRIVVSGYIVRGPLGGLAWHHLQYVLALHLLGHDVIFIEDSDDYACCFNPVSCTTSNDPAHGIRFLEDAFSKVGLLEKWAYYNAHKNEWLGPRQKGIQNFLKEADIFLNLSGMTRWRNWFETIPKRVYLDTDPAFTQIRLLEDRDARNDARQHTHFYTFAGNVNLSSCTLPDDGFTWQPTRQPVVASQWKNKHSTRNSLKTPEQFRLTTVMQWDSYASRQYEGIFYGMKSQSFESMFSLPTRVDKRAQLEIAIGSETAPIDRLKLAGWQIESSLEITRTIDTYRNYLMASDAEFSVAKQGYVATRSGWFSERSINYLAAGKPVIVEDTGFSEWLPCGEGVLEFKDVDSACEAIDALLANPALHQEAASSIAETCFSPHRVLGDLVDELYSSSSTTVGGILQGAGKSRQLNTI